MIDTERFKIKKHTLKEIIAKISPNSYSYELETYDFLIKICDEENQKVINDLEEVYSPFLQIKDISEIVKAIEESKEEALFWKMKHRHDPAYIIVHNFGADNEYNYKKHLSKFEENEKIKGKHYLDPEVLPLVKKLRKEDGALILDNQQKILYTHAHLINLDPTQLIKKYYPEPITIGYNPNSARYFGFHQDLNTRHLSALYASFHLPQSIIYTLGERIEILNEYGELIRIDDGHIRRYQEGLITFSTHDEEKDTITRNIEILLNK